MQTNSTRSKGDSFADKILGRVEELAEEGGLPFSPSTCRVYREKGYPSPRRDDLIKLDVTIEVWPPNANRWSLLWAFECKNHATPIKDSHLTKFFAQLEEVAPCNKKGIVVSTSTFTKNALTYARNTGMGLIRILPDDQVDYVMYGKVPSCTVREDSSPPVDEPFLVPGYRGKNNRLYATCGGKLVYTLTDLISEMSRTV